MSEYKGESAHQSAIAHGQGQALSLTDSDAARVSMSLENYSHGVEGYWDFDRTRTRLRTGKGKGWHRDRTIVWRDRGHQARQTFSNMSSKYSVIP